MTQAMEPILEPQETTLTDELGQAWGLLAVPGQGDIRYHLARAGVGLGVFLGSVLLVGAMVSLPAVVGIPAALLMPFVLLTLLLSYVALVYCVCHVAGCLAEAWTAMSFYLLSMTLALFLLLAVAWIPATLILAWMLYWLAGA